jgi:hypothetical protein
MMDGFGRGFDVTRGFLPGFGALGLGFRFLLPLAVVALIVLVVFLLVRRPKPVAAVVPVATNPPVEPKQV